MEKCNNCKKEVKQYWWENLFKGFCSKECTNEYLESEGFNPIETKDQSATIKEKYRHLWRK